MKEGLEKIRLGQKNQIVLLVLAGVLLLIITIPTKDSGVTVSKTVQTEHAEVEASQKEQLEQRLQTVLETVSGVGKTEVMISLKSDGKKIVEKDLQVSEDEESSADASKVYRKDSSESTVYQQGTDGKQMPYVTETMEPEITGVLVVSQGADDPVIITEITEAVMALFGVEAHKIKVMKME